MKNKVLIFIIISFFAYSCKKKNVTINNIETAYDSLKMDSNWKAIKFEDGEVFYYPKSWQSIDNQNYTLYFKVNENLNFYLDITQDTLGNNNFEQQLLGSVKEVEIKESKILKMRFKNSSSNLYFVDVLGNKNKKYREISNFFDYGNKRIYRFTITSNKPSFDDKYIDTLNIITNTYFINKNKRLVPFKNRVEKIEFLQK